MSANMLAVRYRKNIVRALWVVCTFCTMFIILKHIMSVDPDEGVDPDGVDPDEGFVYFPSDLTNTTLFNKTKRNADDGRCILRDRYMTNRKSVDLRVIVITYSRPSSLWRLLESLEQAYYEEDRIVFEIWLDRSKSHLVHNETLQAALNFKFSKGKCQVFVHSVHVGITGQWLTTWLPPSESSEIALILEDDLTVSPHFYRYLKLVHEKYSHKHDIYGFSLQGNTMRHSDGKCCLDVSPKHKVFLYPTLGTSGFSPNNRHWLKFHTWYNEIIRRNVTVPMIENHISAMWYNDLAKVGKADSMWEMEYLYYTKKHKEFTLYPAFQDHRGLTFNWFEDGLHSTGMSIKNKEEEQKKLVITWTLDFEQLPDDPIYLDDSGAVIR